MARTKQTVGNCYFCGKELVLKDMKKHILKEHANCGEEDCMLLLVEGRYDDFSWLILDMPLRSKLKSLDSFLREIWLECCGHMSGFFVENRAEEMGMGVSVESLEKGDILFHEYDFGTTTETKITVLGQSRRQKQKKAIRLLARNAMIPFVCIKCGKAAKWHCYECQCDEELETDAVYCEHCARKYEDPKDHVLLPLTNSPRCGCCGYDGLGDKFGFDPSKLLS